MRSFNNHRSDRSDRPQMFTAICDECGKECKVPFKPSGDKPIYCSECFEKKGGGSDRGRSRDFGSRRSSGRYQDRGNYQMKEINEKLDKILRILEENTF